MNRRAVELIKRPGRWVRRTAAGRWASAMALGAQYRYGTPGGRTQRVVSTVLRFDLVNQPERDASVAALVERFFGAVSNRPIGVFVEAGAKDAGASVRARNELQIPRAVAFEANPYTHRRFESSVVGAGVEYRCVALTEAAGPQTFYVRRDRKTGDAIADGQASLLVRPDHDPGYEEVTVDGVALDDAIGAGEERVALWVDVEGATSMVLRGAERLLRRTDVAIVEVEDRVTWNGQEWLHHDVVSFMAAAGLLAVGRDQQSRYQFNVLFERP